MARKTQRKTRAKEPIEVHTAIIAALQSPQRKTRAHTSRHVHFEADSNAQTAQDSDIIDDTMASSVEDANNPDTEYGIMYMAKYGRAPATQIRYKATVKKMQAWAKDLPRSKQNQFCDGLEKLGPNSEEFIFKWISHRIQTKKTWGTLCNDHAAFVDWFASKHECSRNVSSGWHLDGTKWNGNPAYSQRCLDLRAAKKRQEAASNRTPKRSMAMHYPTIGRILDGIDHRLYPLQQMIHTVQPERTRLELMRFFMILAYRLWARADELVNLTWAAMPVVPSTTYQGNHAYLEVVLTLRKTNQTDAKLGDDYKLYTQRTKPKVDAVQAYLQWRAYYTLANNGCQPRPNDLVFPNARKSGQLERAARMDSEHVNAMLRDDPTIKSIHETRNAKYTSHCFRRGGLQDELLYAGHYDLESCSIQDAQWWGAWDTQHNMLKYLLQEVADFETYAGDRQNPDANHRRKSLLSGGRGTETERQNNNMQFKLNQLEKQMHLNHTQLQQLLIDTIQVNGKESNLRQLATTLVEHAQARVDDLPGTSAAIDASTTLAAVVSCGIPVDANGKRIYPTIPPAKTLDDVVQQWNAGNSMTGLLPLGSWDKSMRTSGPYGNATVYSQRKIIMDGYKLAGGIPEAFYTLFGANGRSLTSLQAAIQKYKKELAKQNKDNTTSVCRGKGKKKAATVSMETHEDSIEEGYAETVANTLL